MSDCALTAVIAMKRLEAEGMPSRLLMLAHPDDGEGHCAVAFQTSGGLLVYDDTGTIEVPGANLRSSAMTVAKIAFPGTKAAYWYGVGSPKTQGRDRKLSPREVRSFVPHFDRLLAEHEASPPDRPRFRFGKGVREP
jgi:hypothetical protein